MSSKPIALLARHGDTTLSDDGIIISRTDVMPNPEGDAQMDEQLEFLGDYDGGDTVIHSSPLVRCIIPATKFANGRPVLQNRGLLPWDRGVLTGVLSDEAKPLMNLLVVNPDVKIPHGESRRDAEKRIHEFFADALSDAESKFAVFFTHHTVIDLLNGMFEGETVGDPKNIVEVGGVAAVFVDGDGYRMEAVLKPAPSEDSVVAS